MKSTVRPSARATRQPPCAVESGNGAPLPASAYARAARSGSGQAMSRSSTGRPSSSSRTVPPTTYASWPARISAARSSIDHRPRRPLGVGRMPVTSSYVIVPACRACSSASRPSPTSVTGVPGSARPSSSTANESIETVPTTRRRSPATSTSVPVRSRRKPSAYPTGTSPIHVGRSGDERAAVARALAGREPLHLRQLAAPGEHRLEPVLGRVGAERRQAVERDAAPGGVEPGRGKAQRGGAVRRVQGQIGVGPQSPSRKRTSCSRRTSRPSPRWPDGSSARRRSRGELRQRAKP